MIDSDWCSFRQQTLMSVYQTLGAVLSAGCKMAKKAKQNKTKQIRVHAPIEFKNK